MSDADDKIEKIGKISSSSVSGAEKLDRFNHIVPNRDYFEHLMNQKAAHEQSLETVRLEDTKRPTPMEEAQRAQHRIDRADMTSMNQLLAQAERAIEKIDSVKRKLATPNLDLKQSVQNVLRSKLTHIDESLKIALSKVGVDYVPPEKPQGLISPVQKFIGFLTHAQGQIESLSVEAQRLQDNKDHMSAASLLSLQLKVGLIQQQLEFFSSVLNKTLESTKTIMNVQV